MEIAKESTNFIILAQKMLNHIYDVVDNSYGNVYDMDYNGEVMTIDSDNISLIINIHVSANEIWVASSVSGPHHFRYESDKWITKSRLELISLLSSELKIAQKAHDDMQICIPGLTSY
jgi:iron donor protein CyaY